MFNILNLLEEKTGKIYISAQDKTCNLNCKFCIGKQTQRALLDLNNIYQTKINNALNVNFNNWPNFTKYINYCKTNEIKQILISGLNTDPSIYPWLYELIDFLKDNGFQVSITTNAKQYSPEILNKIDGILSISVQSFVPKTNKNIIGEAATIELDKIINAAPNVGIATVLDELNNEEIIKNAKYLTKFKNIKYYQVRSNCNPEENLILFKNFIEKIKTNYEVTEKSGLYICKVAKLNLIISNTQIVDLPSLNYITNGIIIDNTHKSSLNKEFLSINDKILNKHQAVQNFIKANW